MSEDKKKKQTLSAHCGQNDPQLSFSVVISAVMNSNDYIWTSGPVIMNCRSLTAPLCGLQRAAGCGDRPRDSGATGPTGRTAAEAGREGRGKNNTCAYSVDCRASVDALISNHTIDESIHPP